MASSKLQNFCPSCVSLEIFYQFYSSSSMISLLNDYSVIYLVGGYSQTRNNRIEHSSEMFSKSKYLFFHIDLNYKHLCQTLPPLSENSIAPRRMGKKLLGTCSFTKTINVLQFSFNEIYLINSVL